MNEKKKEKKGISLIVLVITIIIMIILASAVIISLNGSNIISKAHEAVDRFNEGTEKEKIQTILLSSYKNNELTEEGIKEAVDREFRTNTSKVKLFNDGSITIYIESSKREYYIDNKGNITITNVESVIDTEGLSGEGTEANPYKINSIEDLVEFSTNISTYRTKYIELSRDLDFRSFASYREVNKELMDSLTSGEGFNPIDNFNGNFDGQGYTIKNIYENYTTNGVGFFRQAQNGNSTGVIKNLSITGYIKGNNNVGGICAYKTKEITNCNNYVEVIGNENVGGIVDSAGSGNTVENCKNYGKIYGKSGVGGITGAGGMVSSCENHGNITSSGDACGGISGYGGNNMETKKCVNYGRIDGKNFTGGIVGHTNNSGKVEECCNFGEVNGRNRVGGIVGLCWRDAYISNSYNMASVSGAENIGGLIGFFYKKDGGSTATYNCYTTGNVAGTSYQGAAIGYIDNVAINSYCNYFYYLNTILNKGIGTGNDATGIVEGKNETELKGDSMITLLNTNSGSTDETIWVKDTTGINNGYPILSWQLDE